ncbi:hypothetical protein NEUTE2DRAFT_167277 [Neurospora tetrasperma FGSC 2509]|nr:hypothetical protein NEUTE2DRAFT_167277 [Neurospora tetrasperma FGSC 2509]
MAIAVNKVAIVTMVAIVNEVDIVVNIVVNIAVNNVVMNKTIKAHSYTDYVGGI